MRRRTFLGTISACAAGVLTGGLQRVLAAIPEASNSGETFLLGGDLLVNRLGFGAMRLAGEGIWGWPPDRENAKKVLRRAVELGVNFIDTAAFHRMWAAPQRPKNARNLRRSYHNSWSFPRKLSGLHESAAADRYASPARTRLPARRSRVNSLWFSSQSFWKRGSFRRGSNIGSSRRSAGVSGGSCPKVLGLLFRRERGD